jgi:ABC-type uncharacterized transport system permease subunit
VIVLSSVPMRDLLRTGENALLIVLIMLTGSLVLWIGLPLGWLWVASQVTAATDSIGAGLGVTLFGLPISVVVMAQLLTWLSNKHRQVRLARGQEDLGHFVLEVVMVISAAVASAVLAIWFFLFSGSSPIPLQIGL